MKKLLTAFLASLLIISGVSFAQSGFFDPTSTLDAIEDRLGEDDIQVIDFSGAQWGSLPPEIITLLSLEEEGDFESLAQLTEEANFDPQSPTQDSLNELTNLLLGVNGLFDENNPSFLNDNGIRVLNEIRFQGESQLNSIILAIANILRNVLGAFAILFIVISGVQLVIAQGDESKITEQKRAMLWSVVGLVAVILIERMIAIIYGVPGAERGFDTSSTAFSIEIFGLVSYIKFMLGAIAVLMIVISGVRMLAAQGEEDQVTAQKKSLIWIVVGLFSILLSEVVIDNLYIQPVRESIALQTGEQITLTNVQNVINLFGTFMQFILGFLGLIAFGILIYGSVTMVMNYGEDELVENAKKIIKNALLGIVLILAAFAIVATVMRFG